MSNAKKDAPKKAAPKSIRSGRRVRVGPGGPAVVKSPRASVGG